jgi:hypothetical protein
MTTSHPVKPSALDAWLALLMALFGLTDRGQSTPCQRDPEPFTSEDKHEREAAAAQCTHCLVLDACRKYAEANAEPHHVWAGIDRSRKASR